MENTTRLLLLPCLALLLSVSAPAWAQSGAAAAAEALFEQARAEMAEGRYESACKKLRESDKLDPAVGTKFNLAECEQKQGRTATAWELFKAVEQALDAADDRYPIAKQRREALEAVVPRLEIVLAQDAPAGTTVRVGQAELTAAALAVPLPLDPGSHELVVSAPGHAAQTFTIVLEPGKVSEIEVAPGGPRSKAGALPETSGSAAGQSRVADRGGAPATHTRTVGYVAAGVGGLGLVIGTVSGLMALGKKRVAEDNCSDELRLCNQTGKDANDTGRTLATVSTIGFAVGVVGVGVGAYFILAGGEGSQSDTALAAGVSGTSAGLSLVQRW
jgi:hypothetical protein